MDHPYSCAILSQQEMYSAIPFILAHPDALLGSEKALAKLPHIMPDFMLVFAVPEYTHNPTFPAHTDSVSLEQALWFILEPVVLRKEN